MPHRGGAIELVTSEGPEVSTILSQVSTRTLDPGLQQIMDTGGRENTLWSGVVAGKPVARFSTPALDVVLTTIGELTTLPIVRLFLDTVQNLGTVASGSSHIPIELRNCLVVLESISARQGEPLAATFAVYPTVAGAEEAVTVASDAARLALGTVENFTVGPINSTVLGALAQPVAIEYRTNFEVEQVNEGGQAAPTSTFVTAKKPELIVTFLDGGLHTNALLRGGASDDDVDVFFRKLENKSLPYADASTVHAQLTFAESHLMSGEFTIAGSQKGEFGFKWTPIDDGVNDFVAVTLDTAIA